MNTLRDTFGRRIEYLRLSVTDRLTELYNHGYFQQRLEEELGRASRFDHTLSLIMLDIDDFKQFNDTYGHPRGDRRRDRLLDADPEDPDGDPDA